MENNRGRDSKTNQDVHNRETQHRNRREASDSGFEGMNFEQQRESYKRSKSRAPQNEPEERSDSRRRQNDM